MFFSSTFPDSSKPVAASARSDDDLDTGASDKQWTVSSVSVSKSVSSDKAKTKAAPQQPVAQARIDLGEPTSEVVVSAGTGISSVDVDASVAVDPEDNAGNKHRGPLTHKGTVEDIKND